MSKGKEIVTKETSLKEIASNYGNSKNFIDLKNKLDNDFKKNNPIPAVDTLFKTLLEINPKFFTYAFHYLTEQKKVNIKPEQLPKITDIQANNKTTATEKLQQAVEIFRIQQERIEKDYNQRIDTYVKMRKKQGWNTDASSIIQAKEAALKENAELIAKNPIFQCKDVNDNSRNYYLAQAVNGVNIKTEIKPLYESSKKVYLKIDNNDAELNFEDLAKALNNNATEQEFKDGSRFFTIDIDANVSLKNIKSEHIRSYTDGKYDWVKIDGTNYGSDQRADLKNWDFVLTSTQTNPNSCYNKREKERKEKISNQTDINKNINTIIDLIETRIKSLKSSFFYSSAAQSKAAAFEDLVKLIKSNPEGSSLKTIISNWEMGGSRSFANKEVYNPDIILQNPKGIPSMIYMSKRFEKGKELKVSTLMKQTRSLFGDGLSDQTKSMQLIEKIKGLADQVDVKAGIKATVQEPSSSLGNTK